MRRLTSQWSGRLRAARFSAAHRHVRCLESMPIQFKAFVLAMVALSVGSSARTPYLTVPWSFETYGGTCFMKCTASTIRIAPDRTVTFRSRDRNGQKDERGTSLSESKFESLAALATEMNFFDLPDSLDDHCSSKANDLPASAVKISAGSIEKTVWVHSCLRMSVQDRSETCESLAKSHRAGEPETHCSNAPDYLSQLKSLEMEIAKATGHLR